MGGLKRFSVQHRSGDSPAATVHAALAAVHAFADDCGLDRDTCTRLAIVVEELVENAVTHGAAGTEVTIGLELANLGGTVGIVLEDTGLAFDPRAAPDPLAPRADRGGGVGLALVRAWSEIRSYARAGGVNRLDLVLRAPELT